MRSYLLGAVPLVRAVGRGVADNLPIPWRPLYKVKGGGFIVSVRALHGTPFSLPDWAPANVAVSIANRLDALGPHLAGYFFRAVGTWFQPANWTIDGFNELIVDFLSWLRLFLVSTQPQPLKNPKQVHFFWIKQTNIQNKPSPGQQQSSFKQLAHSNAGLVFPF